MKKTIFLILSFIIILLPSFVVHANAALYSPEEFDADIAYMISLDDGTVVCDINSEQKTAPASITKIVTAILTIENCDNFDTVITAPNYCIRLLDGTDSSTAGILSGEELTVKDLLYCLLVYSANDAANILADYIGGGDISVFVDKMNEFVKGLGCENTHFVNAHGLDDPDHYTTARDLAKIYSYCIKNSMFAEIAGTYRYEIAPTNKYKSTRYLINTNGLLNSGVKDYYCEYAKNGKTGTTDNAGRCLVSSASKDGYNYVCVVLNAKFYDCDDDGVNENMAIVESKNLYEWAFENLKLREVANTLTYVCEVEVALSDEYDYVSLVPAESKSALVPSGVSENNVLIEPIDELTAKSVNAPVKEGDVLGRAVIKYADATIAEVDLVAAFSVQRSTVKYIKNIIYRIFHSVVFKIIFALIIIVVFLGVFYIFLILPQKRAAKKNKIRIVKPETDSDDKSKSTKNKK